VISAFPACASALAFQQFAATAGTPIETIRPGPVAHFLAQSLEFASVSITTETVLAALLVFIAFLFFDTSAEVLAYKGCQICASLAPPATSRRGGATRRRLFVSR
jgi:hypothetical protein